MNLDKHGVATPNWGKLFLSTTVPRIPPSLLSSGCWAQGFLFLAGGCQHLLTNERLRIYGTWESLEWLIQINIKAGWMKETFNILASTSW
jgi:hypothetical protein